MPETRTTGGEGRIACQVAKLRSWVVANGGDLVEGCLDNEVRYVSVRGPGAVIFYKFGQPEFEGDGRLALTCCDCGTTLSPFAVRPVEVPRVVQSLRAKANHTVTIISDASYDHESGAAGWAAWMIADGMVSSTAGEAISHPVADIGEAELMALAGALKAAETGRYVIRGAEVLLQSDSLWALAAIRKAIPSARDRKHATAGRAVQPHRKAQWSNRTRSTCEEIMATVDRLSLTIAVRHVPGHRAGDGRQWVNRHCDALAKRHMRSARLTHSLTAQHAPTPEKAP